MFVRALAVVPIVALAVTGCCKIPGLTKEETKGSGTPTTTSASSDKTLVMNHECANDPQLKITKVVRTSTETRVHIRFQNNRGQKNEISTAPPGKPESFFIEAADQTRRMELKYSSGIAVSPGKNTIQPGGSLDFVVVFPAIDDTWSPVDIHEGEVFKKGTTFWQFENVKTN